MLTSEWCAKLYQHGYKSENGWVKVVGETNQLNLPKSENDQATSVKVKPGCILTLFNHYNKGGESDRLTTDVGYLKHNDQVSSAHCTCQRM